MRTHCLVLALLASVPFARAADMVPFVIPQEVSDKSLVALPALPAVATDGPRVKARDGHFFLGDERFRAWGVNFCFAANFPTHEQAKLTARRLSAFGVNAVRLHHMDGQAFPSGIWDPKDPLKLSAEALDRLDFFIDQLAASGIRTNLNLHVSRSHAKALKLPEADKLPSMDKIADLFTPELIAAQKAYARDLLGHVSAYRKVRYADDPAIAWVEINNEDRFFMWGADDTIRKLPEPYAGALRAKFVEYLKARYTDTAGLAKVWNFGTEPAGANLIADGRLATAGQPKSSWHLEQHEGCKADLAPIDGGGAKVTIAKAIRP